MTTRRPVAGMVFFLEMIFLTSGARVGPDVLSPTTTDDSRVSVTPRLPATRGNDASRSALQVAAADQLGSAVRETRQRMSADGTWHLVLDLPFRGPCPESVKFSSSGGSLFVFLGGTAYATQATTLSIIVGLDSTPQRHAQLKGFAYGAGAELHTLLRPLQWQTQGVGVGNHRLTIALGASAGVKTQSNQADFYHLMIFEKPSNR